MNFCSGSSEPYCSMMFCSISSQMPSTTTCFFCAERAAKRSRLSSVMRLHVARSMRCLPSFVITIVLKSISVEPTTLCVLPKTTGV